MVHEIEFQRVSLADVERPEYAYPQRVVIQKGTRFTAHVQPHVAESAAGPIEVADLQLDDGTLMRAIRFSAFRFLEAVERSNA
jgi:hypothetical protein